MASVVARAQAKEPLAAKKGAQPRATGESASIVW
jgi:hypothetical protein